MSACNHFGKTYKPGAAFCTSNIVKIIRILTAMTTEDLDSDILKPLTNGSGLSDIDDSFIRIMNGNNHSYISSCQKGISYN